jgi:putative DNA primase/helicase
VHKLDAKRFGSRKCMNRKNDRTKIIKKLREIPMQDKRHISQNLESKKAAAMQWFELGYQPIPVREGTKLPRLKVKKWLSELSPQTIEQHWADYQNDDIGLYCSNGLVALDSDSPESLEAVIALEKEYGINPLITVKSKKGTHHYFKLGEGVSLKQAGYSTESNPERIDIRCGNSYIIAPPSADKFLIGESILPLNQLEVITQGFADALVSHNGGAHTCEKSQSASNCQTRESDATEIATKNDLQIEGSEDAKLVSLREILSHLDPEEGYSEWVQTLMIIHRETQGSSEGLAIADEWSSRGSSYKGSHEIESKWKSFDGFKGNPVTIASLWKKLSDQGVDPWELKARVEERLEKFSPSNTTIINYKDRNLDSAVVGKAINFPHPERRQNGALAGTFENFEHLMQHYGVEIQYDLIAKDVIIKVPFLRTTVDNEKAVKDGHIRSLCALNNFPATNVNANILTLADKKAINPVKEWIDERPWDGVDRLPDFRDTLIVKADFPKEFKCLLLDRWMVSAVAAVESSDFRARGVLTLSGPQGIGKTSWFNALVTNFGLRQRTLLTGHCLDASKRDSVATAVSKWIVEFGELEATIRKDLPALKSFITNDMDHFRRPYASVDSTLPRRTVFCASVNDHHFLTDPTGNSRFWTIPVTAVNFKHGLDMQQVFAQYKVEYLKPGAKWWLDPDEEAVLIQLNGDFETISEIKEGLTTLVHQGRERQSDLCFMTASNLLKAIKADRKSIAQIKEVHAVMTKLVGPARKTKGVMGWDVPIRISLDDL